MNAAALRRDSLSICAVPAVNAMGANGAATVMWKPGCRAGRPKQRQEFRVSYKIGISIPPF